MDQKFIDDFTAKYPLLTVCGKNNEYYKCNDVLDFIKSTQETTYHNSDKFYNEMITKMSKIHAKSTSMSNADPKLREFYHFKDTPKYLQLKCKVPKCKFMCWYNFDKDIKNEKNLQQGDPVVFQFAEGSKVQQSANGIL